MTERLLLLRCQLALQTTLAHLLQERFGEDDDDEAMTPLECDIVSLLDEMEEVLG